MALLWWTIVNGWRIGKVTTNIGISEYSVRFYFALFLQTVLGINLTNLLFGSCDYFWVEIDEAAALCDAVWLVKWVAHQDGDVFVHPISDWQHADGHPFHFLGAIVTDRDGVLVVLLLWSEDGRHLPAIAEEADRGGPFAEHWGKEEKGRFF